MNEDLTMEIEADDRVAVLQKVLSLVCRKRIDLTGLRVTTDSFPQPLSVTMQMKGDWAAAELLAAQLRKIVEVAEVRLVAGRGPAGSLRA